MRRDAGAAAPVTDAARDVLYHWFDEPVLSRVVADTEAEMRGHLAELAADPTGPDQADRIGRLVWCPSRCARCSSVGSALGTDATAAPRGRPSDGRCRDLPPALLPDARPARARLRRP